MVIILLIIIFIIIYYIFNRKEEYLTNVGPIFGHSSINDPYIKPALVKNLLTNIDCKNIINYCLDEDDKKSIVHISPQRMKYKQEYIIPKNDPLVIKLIKQLALDLYVPFENAENVQIIKFVPNQFTKGSIDACCQNNDRCQEFLKEGGQRIITCIIYLNDDFTGGELYFDNLDMKFSPKIGDGVVFYNVAQNINKCHPASAHSNLITGNGEKWIMKIRFRENQVFLS